MKNLIKRNWLLIVILVLGAFLRIYNFRELFYYGHDQDLAGWIIKDIVVDGHLRLIGQETSTQGIFIGPLFYYLLIPFYLVFEMDPIGGLFLVFLLGIFTIFSFYFVFTKIFSKNVGLIASLLYSVSFYTVMNDREVVPTMPVVLWTVWFLWGVNMVFKNEQKIGYIFLGFLFALTWHLNVALVLLLPLVPLAVLLSRKRLELGHAINGVVSLLFFSMPFILFEFRHNFAQFRYLITAFSQGQKDIVSGTDKVLRTFQLLSKNIHNFLWGDAISVNYYLAFFVFLIILLFLSFKKVLDRKILSIYFFWILLYVIFFSLYSKRLSEYYLNGLIVVFISVFSIFLNWIVKSKHLRIVGISIIGLFVCINIQRFFDFPINRSGYLEKIAIVKEIKKDAEVHNFDCVSVSYITDPGYNLGYRYFLWLEKIKVKPISDKVPVYTIVFPLRPIFKTDIDFGAVGLIYPDYEVYTESIIKRSCQGDDFNLTDTMLGYN